MMNCVHLIGDQLLVSDLHSRWLQVVLLLTDIYDALLYHVLHLRLHDRDATAA